MMRHKVFPILIAAVLCLAGGAVAQNGTFSDPNVDYTFELPDPRWKMTAKPSATSPNVEYVFNDRREGHLAVRKLTVRKDELMTDIIRNEESKLLVKYGYVAGLEENFNGRLRGNIFNFEYADGGRSMSGRFYFLRVNETTIYLLRFTGQKDSLRSIRGQADSIARTFSVK